MDLTTGLAAQQSLNQQLLGVSMVKQASDSQQKVANLIAQSASAGGVPQSSTRGTNVNITV